MFIIIIIIIIIIITIEQIDMRDWLMNLTHITSGLFAVVVRTYKLKNTSKKFVKYGLPWMSLMFLQRKEGIKPLNYNRD